MSNDFVNRAEMFYINSCRAFAILREMFGREVDWLMSGHGAMAPGPLVDCKGRIFDSSGFYGTISRGI